MTIHRPGWKGIFVAVAAIAAVATMTFAVLTMAGVTFGGSGSAQQGSGSETIGLPLLTANRDRLAICVDAVDLDPAAAELAKLQLEAALKEAEKNQNWERAGFDHPGPLVDTGCPSPPAVFLPGARIRKSGFGLFVETVTDVSEASYYRVFVFVTPADKIREVFQGEYPIATQEILWHSPDEFSPVTLGLYFSPEELGTTSYVADWLLVAAGVEPASSVDPTPLLQP